MQDDNTIVPKQKHFLEKRQGDIILPTLFDTVTDAIGRDCFGKLVVLNGDETTIHFYADYGFIGGENNYERVQLMMELIMNNCLSFGFKMNVAKNRSNDIKSDEK